MLLEPELRMKYDEYFVGIELVDGKGNTEDEKQTLVSRSRLNAKLLGADAFRSLLQLSRTEFAAQRLDANSALHDST